jgi:aryl-alcohol dehydrogenase-like predicted oxidoreductase
LLAKKPWIVPLFGTRKVERLDENLGALAVNLSAEDIRELEQRSAQIGVQGERYPAQMLKLSGR